MLSLKNLVKVYQTKGGVPVRALDGVNIEFADKGMVFLLGKSGSGKSTLLNVTGGLDVPTEGEIIVNGKSSKDFASQDWDSYRNTFIGFIFQEYNILEEFSVGQNIALALQLQNKPSSEQDVARILADVDLEGYAKRSPNTLSGGQRQRVAIARALIKNPEIIMADEPTGALDSETGKQIFQTLKKLSEERLVIVVSHDRDFAETYGDRIIELEDGKIISDVTKERVLEEENVSFHDNETVTVKSWSGLSKEDLDKIISFMNKTEGETVITKSRKNLSEIKKITGVREGGKTLFNVTKTDKINKEYDGKPLTLIKSKLPMKNALKMAFGSIKAKPIRLAFTILLSLIAFVFFGVSSTLMLYNIDYSVATAMSGSSYDSYVLTKHYNGVVTERYYNEGQLVDGTKSEHIARGLYTEEQLNELNKNEVGLNFAGLFEFGQYQNYLGNTVGFQTKDKDLLVSDVGYPKNKYFPSKKITGFTDCGAQFIKDNGFTSIVTNGHYPQNVNEIAIPKYVYELYKYSSDNYSQGVSKYPTPDDFIGQEVAIYTNDSIKFTVTDIYDVGNIPEKYDVLLEEKTGLSPNELKILSAELEDYLNCSFHRVLFIHEDFYNLHKYDLVSIEARACKGVELGVSPSYGNVGINDYSAAFTEKAVWQYDEIMEYFDINGNQTTFSDFNMQKDEGLVNFSLITHFASQIRWKIADNPEYADFNSAMLRYMNNNVQKGDVEIILKTVFEKYEEVMALDLHLPTTIYARNANDKSANIKVIGYYRIGMVQNQPIAPFLTDEFLEEFEVLNYNRVEESASVVYSSEHVIDIKNEKYSKLISLTDRSMEQSYLVLANDGITFNRIDNQAYSLSKETSRMINETKPLFYILTLLFGIFASLMMFNFITVSISSRTKEIGILRAVGARGLDVFKIFITEALIVTGICFVLSAVLSGLACNLMNVFIMSEVLSISVLNYGVVNVLMLLVASTFVSILATVFPVVRISKKSPVDSIRSL